LDTLDVRRRQEDVAQTGVSQARGHVVDDGERFAERLLRG
jgi:hypothetical protein